jgi:hypothetical protein
MTIDWASLQVVGADLPPRRRDAPAQLVPIVADAEQRLYRIRDTRHGAEIEPIDPQLYREDIARGDAVEILAPFPAKAGFWLLWLGASGWRYCSPQQAMIELNSLARAALERAEAFLRNGDAASAFHELERSVLAQPEDALARAGLIAVAHKLQRSDVWLFEQWLDEVVNLGREWWLDERHRYPALTTVIYSVPALDTRFHLRPTWLSPGRRCTPSSFFSSVSPGA